MSLRRAMSSSTVRKLNACAVFSISECIAVSHRFDAAGVRAACAFFRPPGFIGVVCWKAGGQRQKEEWIKKKLRNLFRLQSSRYTRARILKAGHSSGVLKIKNHAYGYSVYFLDSDGIGPSTRT
jgi:hypothetical protein